MRDLRLRVYNLVMHEVHELHDERDIDGDEVQAIVSLAKFCADRLGEPISLFEKADIYVLSPIAKKLNFFLLKIPILRLIA